jgi:hypothetical protein
MSLIFNDTLQASGSTGLYTLQALIGGSWTDIHSISGPASGSIEIDASLNAIPVDTTLLPVGQTFDFRWVDSLGNESNIISALVPFLILDYYNVDESITWVNNGGDNWTFSFPYTPPSNELADTLQNTLQFYSGSTMNTLVSDTNITSSQSYNQSGNGAGTYQMSVGYVNSGETHLVISSAMVMVDAVGNVLRSAVFSGFTDISFSGMDLSCTASYQMTNATFLGGEYFAMDDAFNNLQALSTSNPLISQQLPPIQTPIVIIYSAELDPSEWTPGFFPALNSPMGCVMTVTTDIGS